MSSRAVARQTPEKHRKTSPGEWIMARLVPQSDRSRSVADKVQFPPSAWVWLVVVVLEFVLVGLGGLGLVSLPNPNVGFASSAAALAVITTLAVGIERTLETAWTLLDSISGSGLLPKDTADAIRAYTDKLGMAAGPLLENARKLSEQAVTADKNVQASVRKVQEFADRLKKQVDNLQNWAPESTQVGAVARAATTNIVRLQGYLPDQNEVTKGIISGGDSTIAVLSKIAETATSNEVNPGRKAISMLAGAAIGLAVAAAFGLDLITAAGAPDPKLLEHWGIAATGVIVGLGANPTHEVIEAIKGYKDSRKDGAAG